MAVSPEARPVQPVRAASEAAEQLFNEHSGWIYGYCLRVLRSPDEAEDALQTTFLNAYRSLNQGTRPRVGSAWLLRIAQNVCFARLRASGRRNKVELVQDMAVLEETATAPDRPRDDLIGLTDALVRMPRQQRRAILLREWQGLSYSEVADELGLTRSAVETLIFRARRSLAAELEHPGGRTRRRSLHALDLGGLAAAIKGFLAGGAGVKTVAALTVAAATATVVATDPVQVWRDPPDPGRPAAQARLLDAGPSATPRAAVVAPAVTAVEAARSALEPAETRRRRGPDSGPAKAPEAKGKNGNGKAAAVGNGKGKAQAPGQVKKAEGTEGGANGHGSVARENAASRPAGGPPAQAPAKGLEKTKKGKGSR